MRNHAVPCEAKFRPKGLSLFIENALLLPPANQVWSKVIFSEASVILFTDVGGDLPTGDVGGLPLGEGPLHPRVGSLHPEGEGSASGWGVYTQGLGVCIGGGGWADPSSGIRKSGQHASCWNAVL